MKKIELPPEFRTAPAVFAVGSEYQIMVPVRSDLLFWVNVGGTDYYDHSNGIIRSDTRMHRVSVPVPELDSAREYTVVYRKIIERRPYRTLSEDPVETVFPFRPVPETGAIKIYQLADTHGREELPLKTGSFFGDDIDLLVLNGDIVDSSADTANFELIFRLCGEITGGGRPCIFSRGNHDLRGFYAEKIADYTPNLGGKSYFTFRLGRLWGIVLDCGEDKVDSHEEYGHTVACGQFRREETEFLEKVVESGEYAEQGIEYRLAIVHNPFSYTIEPPFDIEQPLFTRWLRILEGLSPQLMLSGHLHELAVSLPGSEMDCKGQTCPVVICSKWISDAEGNNTDFICCAVTLDGNEAIVEFTNSKHEVVERHVLGL